MLAMPLSATHAASAFNAGDLIKGSLPSVYYFAPDGKRYVFPNDKTYFTWFSDFSKVKTVPDSVLSTVPLGKLVTYRPGVKMVKLTTDPKVYAVDQGGVLRHVATEQLAETLFGLNWKKMIDDLPDAFFFSYRVGTPIEMASEYQPANVRTQTTTIAQDKQFDETKVIITIGAKENGYVPSTITVKKGTEVTWTNADIISHKINGKTGGWGSADIRPMNTYSRVFNEVGSFDYTDDVYPVMQGTINVVQ